MAKTRADFPDAQSCGLYSMSGKSFVIIDDDGAFATKPLGKGYEITPLASPNNIKVGELAKFRVTLDGKPVADAKVVGSPAGFNSEEVEIEAFYAETEGLVQTPANPESLVESVLHQADAAHQALLQGDDEGR